LSLSLSSSSLSPISPGPTTGPWQGKLSRAAPGPGPCGVLSWVALKAAMGLEALLCGKFR
jgi:hypothetical protein